MARGMKIPRAGRPTPRMEVPIVHRFTRHLRGLLVALATLALSAGVVLAARPASVEAPPTQAADGLKIATEASGQTVPVRVDAASGSNADEDQDEDADQDEANEAPKVEAGADGEAAANTADRKQNHGWFVSQAAHAATAAAAAATTAATPGSHGLAVSTIARSDVGKPAAATAAAAKPAKPTKTPKATSH